MGKIQVLIAAALVIGFGSQQRAIADSGMASEPDLATPAGITLNSVTVGSGVNKPVDHLVFANDEIRTLYSSDADPAGKSVCAEACLAQWKPVLATSNALPVRFWSVIVRDDGSKQWAYRGKPLYTCDKDPLPKETASDSVGSQFVKTKGAACEGVDGHHIAEFVPSNWMKLPAGITVSEILTAPGMALTNNQGSPLYAFDGDPNKDAELRGNWTPYRAPQAALSVDKFNIVPRTDGDFQWSYEGKPLYLFKGDLTRGDSNGKDVDKRFHLVLVARYFMPTQVTIRNDERRGGIFVTTAEGRTLYASDRVRINRAGNHNARGGDRGDLGIGEAIGLAACDAECEKTRAPLIAPDDAMSDGYWSIYIRPDGKKQWAYQGYALYVDLAEKPGQTTGFDIYNYAIIDPNPTGQSVANTGMGFYWRVSSP